MSDAGHDKQIDIRGVDTHYVETGEGEPVLLIHGGYAGDVADADSCAIWDRVLPALGRRYRTVAVDRLAQGDTGFPANEKDWSLSGIIAHLSDFIAQSGLAPVHLVGHGVGGLAALSIAANERALVRSLTLVSAYPAAPVPSRHELVLNENPHQAFSAEALRFVLERSSFDASHITPDWIQARLQLLQSAPNKAAADRMERQGVYESVIRTGLLTVRESLFADLGRRALQRPTLLIWGFDDPIAPMDGAYALFNLLGAHEHRVEMHVINRCGHYPFREHPGEFVSALPRFLEDVRHGA